MKKYDCIIAINEMGEGFFMSWGDADYWMKDALADYNILPELEFKEKPGLYYANIVGFNTVGCDDDSFEYNFDIFESVFEIASHDPPEVKE